MAFTVVNIQTAINSAGGFSDDFIAALNAGLSAAEIPLTAEQGMSSGISGNGYKFRDATQTIVANVQGQGSNTRLQIVTTVGDDVTAQIITTRGPGYYPTIIYNDKVVAVLDRTLNGTPYTGYFITKSNTGDVVFCGSTNANNDFYMYKNPFSIKLDTAATFGVTTTPTGAQGYYTGYNLPVAGGEYCENLYYCPYGFAANDDTRPCELYGKNAYLIGGAWFITDD